MEKIGLLIDSTTLTREDILIKEYVKVASLGVTLDGIDYDELSLGHERMATMLHDTKKMTTSQPAPGAFLEEYRAFYEEGYTHVLVVTLSEKLSGTFQSALIAKSMIDFPIEISVHSATVASYGVALGVVEIMEMIENKVAFDDIVCKTKTIFENAKVMFTLQDLMHLFKGGRLNRVSALIGTVLRIKPIIEMIDGKLELTKKERTNISCFDYFMDSVKEHVNKYKHVTVDFIHMNRPEWADKFIAYRNENFPQVNYHITNYVSPVFTVHLGDQGFGVAIIAY